MLSYFWSGKSLKVKIVLLALLCFHIFNEIEGKKKKRKHPKYNKKRQVRSHSYGLTFCLVVFSMTFVPLLCYFIYNVIKDPITPTLVKNGSQMIKEKTMGFLSKKGDKEAKRA